MPNPLIEQVRTRPTMRLRDRVARYERTGEWDETVVDGFTSQSGVFDLFLVQEDQKETVEEADDVMGGKEEVATFTITASTSDDKKAENDENSEEDGKPNKSSRRKTIRKAAIRTANPPVTEQPETAIKDTDS